MINYFIESLCVLLLPVLVPLVVVPSPTLAPELSID